jgi:hypothetical protein
MRAKSSRRLACERLENRLCLAGNVTATVTDGVLSVQGDAASNDVEIQQLAPEGPQDPWPGFRYQIIGRNTKINDEPLVPSGNGVSFSIITVEGVKNGVNVFLAAGNDTLRVTRPNIGRANLPGTVSIVMGNGEDDARLYLENHQKVTVQMGGDDDSLRMGGCVVNALTIQTDSVPSPRPGAVKEFADGADQVDIRNLSADGSVSIVTGEKVDSVVLVFAKLRSRAGIHLGPGDDVLGIAQSFSGAIGPNSQIVVTSWSGNDTMSFISGTGGTFSVDTGTGDDEVRLAVGTSVPIQSLSVSLGADNDTLEFINSPSQGASAKLDGQEGIDALFGEENIDFDSLETINFES